jgi:hypothetical protein
MKTMTAGQQSVRQPDTREGPEAWSSDDGRVGMTGTGFATTCPSDLLSPAQVHELLVSSPERRHLADFGVSLEASDFLGESEYVPVTFGSHAGGYGAPERTEPGDSDSHDVLRAARGIIWITVFGVPFWSCILLALYWL